MNAVLRNPYVQTSRAAILDHNQRIVSAEIIGLGVRNDSVVNISRIVGMVERAKEAGIKTPRVLLAHNDPTGNVTPTYKDNDATFRLADVLRRIGASLEDHVITNGDKGYSYAKGTEFAVEPFSSPWERGGGTVDVGTTDNASRVAFALRGINPNAIYLLATDHDWKLTAIQQVELTSSTQKLGKTAAAMLAKSGGSKVIVLQQGMHGATLSIGQLEDLKQVLESAGQILLDTLTLHRSNDEIQLESERLMGIVATQKASVSKPVEKLEQGRLFAARPQSDETSPAREAEIDATIDRLRKDGRIKPDGSVLAENGKESKQYQSILNAVNNPDAALRLYADTKSENFRKWFGDSRVVDENGEPLVVYHGGTVDDVFDSRFSGSHGGRESAFFFTPDIRQARDYAGNSDVKVAYLRLQNPVNTDVQLDPSEVSKAKSEGRDGYWIIEDGLVEESEIAVFSPTQIKSATENDGAYSLENPSIRHSAVTGPVSSRARTAQIKDVRDALDDAGYSDIADVVYDTSEGRRGGSDERQSILGQRGAAALDKAEEVTTRLDNLDVARQMESAQKDALKIKLATGWERGADGKWRYEVPDIDITGNLQDIPTLESKGSGGVYRSYKKGRLTDITNPSGELFQAYPDLRNLNIVIYSDINKNGVLGSFRKSDQTITLWGIPYSNRLSDHGKRTLLHEIQHAIQSIEGFAEGASGNIEGSDTVGVNPTWTRFHSKENQEKVEELNRIVESNEYKKQRRGSNDLWVNSFQGRLDELNRKFAFTENNRSDWESLRKGLEERTDAVFHEFQKVEADRFPLLPEVARLSKETITREPPRKASGEYAYHRSAGEVEARNASSRMSMTPEERRQSLLASTEDVAREDQIFLRDGLEARESRRAESIDADKFRSDLESFRKGTLPTNEVLSAGRTGPVLRALGVQDAPITLTQGIIKKADRHGISIKSLETLPEQIANPVMVFQSTAGESRRIVLTELKSKDGKSIVVALEISGSRQKLGQVVDIRSIHAKEHVSRLMDWAINGGRLLYQNKEKTQAFLQDSAPANWEQYAGKLGQLQVKTAEDIVNREKNRSSQSDSTWEARYNPNATGKKITVNAAAIDPSLAKLKVEHEVFHHAWNMEGGPKELEKLWSAIDDSARKQIENTVRDLYENKPESVQFEEMRVRAAEHIREQFYKTEQGRSAFNKFLTWLRRVWRKLTGQSMTVADAQVVAGKILADGLQDLREGGESQIHAARPQGDEGGQSQNADTTLARLRAEGRIQPDGKVNALNGKPSKLYQALLDEVKDPTRAQELYALAHSEKFREVNGDWEGLAKMKKLLAMPEYISEVQAIQNLSGKPLMEAARPIYEALRGPYQFPDGRRINITARGFREIKNHSADARVMNVAADLRNILDRSIHLWSEDNNDQRYKNVRRFHNYGTRATVVGIDSYIRILIREDNNGEIHYDHDATSIEAIPLNEKGKSADPPTRVPNAGEDQAGLARNKLVQWFNSVNPDSVTAKLDENGEPVVTASDIESAMRDDTDRLHAPRPQSDTDAEYGERLASVSDPHNLSADEAEDLQEIVDRAADERGYLLSHRRSDKKDPRKTGHVILFAEEEAQSNLSYGPEKYMVRPQDLPEIPDWAIDWLEQNESFRDLVKDNVEDLGSTYREEAKQEINPSNIVENAGIWDNPEIVSEFWEENAARLLDDGIAGFQTQDGAVIFDPTVDLLKSAAPITFDKSGNPIPLEQRFDRRNPSILHAPRPQSDESPEARSQSRFEKEKAAILANAKRDGQGRLLAPNGKPTNLTEDQWAATRTKAFLKWFGDWMNDPKNASKVVDKNGEPLVVYHGTDGDFSVFQMNRKTERFGSFWVDEIETNGAFFSPNEEDAGGYGENVIPVFLNIRNAFGSRPKTTKEREQARYILEAKVYQHEVDGRLRIDTDNGISAIDVDSEGLWVDRVLQDDGLLDWDYLDDHEFVKRMTDRGYDGAKVYEPDDQAEESWFVTSPTQIKSATDNDGAYSDDNPSILHAARPQSDEATDQREARIDATIDSLRNSGRIKPDGRVLAENGKPSMQYQSLRDLVGDTQALRLYADTQNDNFRKWFRDSSAVDANGEPLVVYHGTKSAGFDVFEKELLGSNTRAGSATLGHFFASNRETAESGSYVERTVSEDTINNTSGVISAANDAITGLYQWAQLYSSELQDVIENSRAWFTDEDGVIVDYMENIDDHNADYVIPESVI